MSPAPRRQIALDTRGLALLAGLGLVIALLVGWRYTAPPPVPAEAPELTFSAARAGATLRNLLDGVGPHPAGSPANARVRERLITHLAALGYKPEVQETRSCGRYGACADIANVLVRVPGSDSGGVVVLAAHYDSVPEGPGASDDGVGVAALLEIIRIVKVGLPLKHDTVFLFDDGEELGLLGAEAFVRSHRWASEARVVINLEARGTSGPSLMFETTPGGGWLVERFAREAPGPVANSIAATVYALLPNDTDLTVFREAGVQGLNFGFIGDPRHYHTSRDDLAHVSPESLQHHGDNALAALRGLQLGPLEPPGDDAIFFDVLTLTLVRWPIWIGGAMVALALLFCVAIGALLIRRGDLRGREVAWGLLGWPVAMGVALSLGALGQLCVRAATDAIWMESPLWLLAIFDALAVCAVCLTGWLLGRRAGFWGLWLGVWIWWAAIALTSLLTLPGMSYPMTLPLLLAGIVGISAAMINQGAKGWRRAACAVPWGVAGLLWFPVGPLFYDAMGHGAIAAIPVLMAFAGTAVLPVMTPVNEPS